ncbi:MAG: cysteine desulfurase [bacterium]|nr:cysteine desulfurase [bacterium]
MNIVNAKNEFPILSQKINGKDLVYLDNSATSQKPQVVIDSIVDYYTNYNSNVHRGIHTLAEKATEKYEEVRQKVADFINAKSVNEIIFTKGTTESLNFLASSLGKNFQKDDEIILTEMEHHSNIVPWQFIAKEKGLIIKYIEVKPDGTLDIENLESLINKKTKIISLIHVSNVLGTINPVEKIIKRAKLINPDIIAIVDIAQSVPHMKVNVQKIKADFVVFSAHKMLGPTGVGVLWGKYDLLEKLHPFLGGGSMIASVTKEKTLFAEIPQRFEAGTPNIAGVIGFGTAIDYINKIGIDEINSHEQHLTKYAMEQIKQLDFIEIYGPNERAGIISFNIKGVHSHDVSAVLDNNGIAVRSGHHCTDILHNKLNINSTVRASFYLYNNENDVEQLVLGLKKVNKIFK